MDDLKFIIDIESTCSDENDKSQDQITRDQCEIIEIGGLIVDSNWNPVEEFVKFSKPAINPTLTEFCINLTGITQDIVDDAPYLNQVMMELEKFLKEKNITSYYSWGTYDHTIMSRECRRKGIIFPLKKHTNLKVAFAKGTKTKRMGILNALNVVDLEFVGNHHRGIDDAINIARIVKRTNEKLKSNKWIDNQGPTI